MSATILPVLLRKTIVSTDKALALTVLALRAEGHCDASIDPAAIIVAARTLYLIALSLPSCRWISDARASRVSSVLSITAPFWLERFNRERKLVWMLGADFTHPAADAGSKPL